MLVSMHGLMDYISESHSPFVHTKWNLNANGIHRIPASNAITDALNYEGIAYIAGYMSGASVPVGNTRRNFLAYANGATPTISSNGYQCEIETFDQTRLSMRRSFNIWQPLCCSRMS